MKVKTERPHDGIALRRSLIATIKASSLSREQIADEISKLIGYRVTVRQLNNFTADSRPDCRFPVELVIAFCEVLQNYSFLREIVKRAGFQMIGPHEERLITIGKAWEQKKRAEKILAGGDL